MQRADQALPRTLRHTFSHLRFRRLVLFLRAYASRQSLTILINHSLSRDEIARHFLIKGSRAGLVGEVYLYVGDMSIIGAKRR